MKLSGVTDTPPPDKGASVDMMGKDQFYRGAASQSSPVTVTLLERLEKYGGRAVLSRDDIEQIVEALRSPAQRQPDPSFRSQVFLAAERSNKKFGQWMPQQWLEIFIGEMMVDSDD